VRLNPVIAEGGLVADAVAQHAGVDVQLVDELDVDVYRVVPDRPGPSWVVRAFDEQVSAETLQTTARVLQRLDGTPFPAERVALDQPLIDMPGGDCHLLVTEYIEPGPAQRAGVAVAWCAGLLGRLAAAPSDRLPDGGGWHRLGATPAGEISSAMRLVEIAAPSAGELLDALADADDGAGLTTALIHPDLTPANAIPQGERPPVIIDWVGVGHGPRLWPLSFLLLVAGPRAAPLVISRYQRSVTLTDEEWQRLPGVMAVRSLTLDCWSVAFERLTVQQAVARHRHRGSRIRASVAAAASLDRGQRGR
jgi:Ser/Thr protein kinase RdoA (MazF antagonist)